MAAGGCEFSGGFVCVVEKDSCGVRGVMAIGVYVEILHLLSSGSFRMALSLDTSGR